MMSNNTNSNNNVNKSKGKSTNTSMSTSMGTSNSNSNSNSSSNKNKKKTTGPLHNPRYKTQLCMNYEKQGRCPYGNKCQYCHGVRELEAWKNKREEYIRASVGLPKHEGKRKEEVEGGGGGGGGAYSTSNPGARQKNEGSSSTKEDPKMAEKVGKIANITSQAAAVYRDKEGKEGKEGSLVRNVPSSGSEYSSDSQQDSSFLPRQELESGSNEKKNERGSDPSIMGEGVPQQGYSYSYNYSYNANNYGSQGMDYRGRSASANSSSSDLLPRTTHTMSEEESLDSMIQGSGRNSAAPILTTSPSGFQGYYSSEGANQHQQMQHPQQQQQSHKKQSEHNRPRRSSISSLTSTGSSSSAPDHPRMSAYHRRRMISRGVIPLSLYTVDEEQDFPPENSSQTTTSSNSGIGSAPYDLVNKESSGSSSSSSSSSLFAYSPHQHLEYDSNNPDLNFANRKLPGTNEREEKFKERGGGERERGREPGTGQWEGREWKGRGWHGRAGSNIVGHYTDYNDDNYGSSNSYATPGYNGTALESSNGNTSTNNSSSNADGPARGRRDRRRTSSVPRNLSLAKSNWIPPIIGSREWDIDDDGSGGGGGGGSGGGSRSGSKNNYDEDDGIEHDPDANSVDVGSEIDELCSHASSLLMQPSQLDDQSHLVEDDYHVLDLDLADEEFASRGPPSSSSRRSSVHSMTSHTSDFAPFRGDSSSALSRDRTDLAHSFDFGSAAQFNAASAGGATNGNYDTAMAEGSSTPNHSSQVPSDSQWIAEINDVL